MKSSRHRIINVTRKPRKCPVCGEQVWDIIYGTGDMEEIEFLWKYRQSALMGGDLIPKKPLIWGCSACNTFFRKVNKDGTDAEVKVKLLKNVRKKPATIINWCSSSVGLVPHDMIKNYLVEVRTALDEIEILKISAINKAEAIELAIKLVEECKVGLNSDECSMTQILSEEADYGGKYIAKDFDD